MTTNRKLEDLFGVAPAESVEESSVEIQDDTGLVYLEADEFEKLSNNLEMSDKIDRALPLVADLEQNDKELDELANTAKTTFDELMNLGMSMEERFSGKVFEVASQMLGHAITAKNAKVDKKLRMVELQLKKRRLDMQEEKEAKNSGEMPEDGDGFVMDRNSLLEQILNKSDK